MTATKQQLALLAKIQKKVLKEIKCQCPGCTEFAINSHLLQRHGILNNISCSHKFREVKYRYPLYWLADDNYWEFKSIGINEALSYPIFCAKHDTELFRSIEVKNFNLDNYRNQLLYSYRALCGELVKIEIVFTQWLEFKKNNEELNISFNDEVSELLRKLLCTGNSLRRLKDELTEEINHNSGLFYFKHYTYPKLDIYASAIYGEDEYHDLPAGIMIRESILFIHIIPRENTLEIIVGYPQNHVNSHIRKYTELWGNLDANSLGYMLTDLFATKIENFGMSEELYNKIPEETKMRFIEFKNQHCNDDAPIDFNLFAGF